MRKIKNAVNNTTGELIYFKGHAKATYMSDGSTVEDAINSIDIPSLDGYVTETELNDKGFLTEHLSISHLASKEELNNIDFYSLQNNPVVNTEEGKLLFVDESGNIGLQLEADNTLYVKDVVGNGHILSSKQDTLVSGSTIKTINGESILGSGDIVISGGGSNVTEQTVADWGFTKNTGTVTGVKVNGSTKNPSSGIVDLGTVITAVDSSMSSTSTNPVQNKIIKSYIDSNCNIPTETTTASSKSLTANKYCRWTNTPTSITITLATPSNTSIVNNYMFEFTASSSGCTLSVPSTIKWINGTVPSIEAGKTYQISIINNLATVAKFS